MKILEQASSTTYRLGRQNDWLFTKNEEKMRKAIDDANREKAELAKECDRLRAALEKMEVRDAPSGAAPAPNSRTSSPAPRAACAPRPALSTLECAAFTSVEGVLHKPQGVGDYTNHDLTRSLPSPCDLNFGSSQNDMKAHLERQAAKRMLYRLSGMALNPASCERVLDMDDGFLDEERFECVLRPPPAMLAARRKVSDQYVGAKLGESVPAKGSIEVLTKHMMWSTWRSSVQKAAQRLEFVH